MEVKLPTLIMTDLPTDRVIGEFHFKVLLMVVRTNEERTYYYVMKNMQQLVGDMPYILRNNIKRYLHFVEWLWLPVVDLVELENDAGVAVPVAVVVFLSAIRVLHDSRSEKRVLRDQNRRHGNTEICCKCERNFCRYIVREDLFERGREFSIIEMLQNLKGSDC